jgi:hypothetical protein
VSTIGPLLVIPVLTFGTVSVRIRLAKQREGPEKVLRRHMWLYNQNLQHKAFNHQVSLMAQKWRRKSHLHLSKKKAIIKRVFCDHGNF